MNHYPAFISNIDIATKTATVRNSFQQGCHTTKGLIRFEGEWQLMVDYLEKDTPIFLLFHASEIQFPFLVNDKNFLIINPSTLISPTTLVSASNCILNAVWKEKCMLTSSSSVDMLMGTIIHSLIQDICCNENKQDNQQIDLEYLTDTLQKTLPQFENEIIALDMTMNEFQEQIQTQFPNILKSIHQLKEKFKDFAAEEMLLDPILGLKGYIDLCAINKKNGFATAIEIKTGKNEDIHHTMQVLLYSYMMKTKIPPEKYDNTATLLYSKTNKIIQVDPTIEKHQQIFSSVLILRNRIAFHLNQKDFHQSLQRESCHNKNCECKTMYISSWEQELQQEESTQKQSTLGSNQNIRKQEKFFWRMNDGTRNEGRNFIVTDLALDNNMKLKVTMQGPCCLLKKAVLSTLDIFAMKKVSIISSNFHSEQTTSVGQMVSIYNTIVECDQLNKNEQLAIGDICFMQEMDQKNIPICRTRGFLQSLNSGSMEHQFELKDILNLQYEYNFVAEKNLAPTTFFPEKRNIVCEINQRLEQNQFALLHGLPGNGKTTTITQYVLDFIGKTSKSSISHQTDENVPLLPKILVTAYTHAAIENLCKRFKEKHIPFIRIGSPETDHHTKWDQVQVVMTTNLSLSHSFFQWYSPRLFDIVIVDEAAQITEPICIGALNLAKKFLLVGDDLQLPPLVIGETNHDLDNQQNQTIIPMKLAKSLFEKLRKSYPSCVVTLTTQYRMHPDILELSNQLYYEPRGLHIETDPSVFVREENRKQKNFKAGIEFIHIVGHETETTNGYMNLFEIQRIEIEIRALIQQGHLQENIGVITPYNAQVHQLRKTLDTVGYRNIIVATADTFQGSQQEIILFSFVRSNNKNQVGKLLCDFRRLHVAMTRAESLLMLFGNKETLKSSGNRDLTKLIEFLKV